jgi:ketopantoate hydroxymethyltransferase
VAWWWSWLSVGDGAGSGPDAQVLVGHALTAIMSMQDVNTKQRLFTQIKENVILAINTNGYDQHMTHSII